MSTPERTYGGRYTVIERVGVGGMAEVYKARDDLLGREVAVKVLSDRFVGDRAFVDRFRREAQSAANLNHPNIVALYDFGADGDTHFIVMEYIDGRSLSDLIRAEGPLMPERAAEIAGDVARALSAAHKAGLVHRDIKPSNIMLTSDGQTKVTDFGIARALTPNGEQTVTQTGMVIGTAAYLSPEQAQGEPLDQRSDIYSLGCVLYESLTGAAPFSGETPLSIAYKHVRENPAPPSQVNPDVPRTLDAVVLKAMAKNADNRYQTADEVAADLGRFLSGEKVQATPLLADSTAMIGAATGTQMMREVDEGPPRRGAGAWYIAGALAALLIVGLLAWLLAGNLLGKEVTVPNVVGESRDDAIRALNRVGLDFEIEEKASKKPENQVFKQDPVAGETVREGDTVTLFVSIGPKEADVPDLEGMTVEEAEEALADVDLELGSVEEEPSEDVEEGLIARSDPPAGDTVAAGTEVDVFVSTGPEAVIVPFVEGQTEEQARAEIEGAGLVPEVTTAPDDAPEGTVIAQDPEGGTEAQAGDTVRITVSEGPEERAMPNVIGLDADEAQALLENDYGLNVSQVEQACPTQEPGRVCDQDPPEGTPVSPGDDATLFVQPGDAMVPGGFWPVALLLALFGAPLA